jgi:hypothetical protein
MGKAPTRFSAAVYRAVRFRAKENPPPAWSPKVFWFFFSKKNLFLHFCFTPRHLFTTAPPD